MLKVNWTRSWLSTTTLGKTTDRIKALKYRMETDLVKPFSPIKKEVVQFLKEVQPQTEVNEANRT